PTIVTAHATPISLPSDDIPVRIAPDVTTHDRNGKNPVTVARRRYVANMPRRRSGYTLLELIVVVALMGLAAALVLPILRPRGPSESAMQAIVTAARQAAAQRGEVIYVRFEPSGDWHMEG